MITIDQVATARAGKECETGDDFMNVGLQIFGGCMVCGASIACYNAYPTKLGFWQCGDCVSPKVAFETVAEFEAFSAKQGV